MPDGHQRATSIKSSVSMNNISDNDTPYTSTVFRAMSSQSRRPHSQSIGGPLDTLISTSKPVPIGSRNNSGSSSHNIKRVTSDHNITTHIHPRTSQLYQPPHTRYNQITRSTSNVQIELLSPSGHSSQQLFDFDSDISPQTQRIVTPRMVRHTSITPRTSPSTLRKASGHLDEHSPVDQDTLSPTLPKRHRSYQQQHEPLTNDQFEVVRNLSDDATCMSYLVRNKTTGELSVFKPQEGEAYLQQRQLSYNDDNDAKQIEDSKFGLLPESSGSPPTQPMSTSPETDKGALIEVKTDGRAVIESKHEMTRVKAAIIPVEQRVPVKHGVEYGDSSLKEVAAYLMDHNHFASVPATFAGQIWLKRASNTSRLLTNGNNDARSSDGSDGEHADDVVTAFGSLQDFKDSIGSAEDMGPTLFDTESVHRIGILDIRLLNLDRHLGNILVTKNEQTDKLYKLVPIDHGYILPSYRDLRDVHLEWSHWRQCNQPFSNESLDYIANLNPLADALQLHTLGVRDEALVAMVFSSLLLQRGAAAGLTLAQISDMVQRQNDTEQSILERIVNQVIEIVNVDKDESSDSDSGSSVDSGPHISIIHTPQFSSNMPFSKKTINNKDKDNNSRTTSAVPSTASDNVSTPSSSTSSWNLTALHRTPASDPDPLLFGNTHADNDLDCFNLGPPVVHIVSPPINMSNDCKQSEQMLQSPPTINLANISSDSGLSLFANSPRIAPLKSSSPPEVQYMQPAENAKQALMLSESLLGDEEHMRHLLEVTCKVIDEEIERCKANVRQNALVRSPSTRFKQQQVHTQQLESQQMSQTQAQTLQNVVAQLDKAEQASYQKPKYVVPARRAPKVSMPVKNKPVDRASMHQTRPIPITANKRMMNPRQYSK